MAARQHLTGRGLPERTRRCANPHAETRSAPRSTIAGGSGWTGSRPRNAGRSRWRKSRRAASRSGRAAFLPGCDDGAAGSGPGPCAQSSYDAGAPFERPETVAMGLLSGCGGPLPAIGVSALILLSGCESEQAALTPIEAPAKLQAAEPRVSGAIPSDKSRLPTFEARGVATTAAVTAAPALVSGQGGEVTLNFVDT